MYDEIQRAYESLTAAVARFNKRWPSLVVAGKVWDLPLLQEQRTPEVIEVAGLTGSDAIDAAIGAISSFERDVGQAAGTVMRLPGYFQLKDSVLQNAIDINDAKQQLAAAIDAERIAQNLTAEMRPRIMRRALGSATFSTKQLQRSVHAFDGAPRRMSFTWAGHTTGTERIMVAKVREQLMAEAETRAANEEILIQDTPEFLDLTAIMKLSDSEVLIRHKSIAPHPRCTIWFGPTGERWSAQPKANLPVFVLAGETPMKLSELKTFDKTARGGRRRDVKNRKEVWPQRDMYLASAIGNLGDSHQVEQEDEHQVPSTYRLGGVVYERS